MLLKDFISRARTSLSSLYGPEEAAAIVSSWCSDVLGVRPHTHIVYPETEVPKDRQPVLEAGLKRLAAGEPLQYVLGYAEFYGRRFNVSPAVLVPRPETEYMCRMLIEKINSSGGIFPDLSVLDLCTGSGCIAWTVQLAFPSASVTGADISDEALQVASSQPFSGPSPVFMKRNVLERQEMFGLGRFDVIVSNPPYVTDKEKAFMSKNVLDHEPSLALFVPDDDPMLFYRAIADFSAGHLSSSGFGIVEINEAFGHETAAEFLSAGFSVADIYKDLAGKDRFVFFCR